MDLSENSKRRVEASYKTWIDIGFNNRDNPFKEPCRLDISSSGYEMIDFHGIDEADETCIYNQKLFRPKPSNELEEKILCLTGHRYRTEVANCCSIVIEDGISVGIDSEPYREPNMLESMTRRCNINVGYFWKTYIKSFGNPESEDHYGTSDATKMDKFDLETREAYETRMLTDKRRED